MVRPEPERLPLPVSDQGSPRQELHAKVRALRPVLLSPRRTEHGDNMTCPNCGSEMEPISYGWFHCLTCCGNGDCAQKNTCIEKANR